jgi:hypothetical protein
VSTKDEKPPVTDDDAEGAAGIVRRLLAFDLVVFGMNC